MKTGEIAKMMGVSPRTITNWTEQDELQPYFSDQARLTDGFQRECSSEDIMVINTIRLQKNRRNTWADVAVILSTGHRETELPITAALTKSISPADHVAQMMLIKAERDTALAQLQDAMFEIERARKETKEKDTTINELYKRLGRLEAQVEMLQARLEDRDDK